MINILKGEFYKLIKGRAFWLCLISICLICAGTPLFLKFMIYDQQLNVVYEPIHDSLFVLAEEFIFNVMGVLTAIFIIGEYSTGSITQISGRGINRVYFFCGKFCTIAVANITLMISSVVSRYLGASLVFHYEIQISLSEWYKIGIILLGEIIVTLGFTSMYCLISYVFRNMAIAIPVNCAVITVQKIVSILIVFVANNMENVRDWWFIEMATKIASFNEFSIENICKLGSVFLICMIVSLAASLTIFLRQDF